MPVERIRFNSTASSLKHTELSGRIESELEFKQQEIIKVNVKTEMEANWKYIVTITVMLFKKAIAQKLLKQMAFLD